MAWQPSLYTWLGAGAAVIVAGVALQAWRHRDRRDARPFVALLLAVAGWSLVYAVQLGYTIPAGQLLWQRVALAVGGTVPTFWFLFTLQYAGKEDLLAPRWQWLLAVDPLVFALLVLTNPAHGLVWHDATLGESALAVSLEFGAGYYLHIVYAYALVAAGLGLLVFTLARASRVYRRQTGLLILGAVPPFVANISFTLGASWGPLPALDPTPFAFVFTGVLFGLALVRFDLLERVPVAQMRVLEEMGDGLVVLDAEGVVVDTNPVAEQALDPPPSIGDPITDLGVIDAQPTDSTGTVDGTLAAIDRSTITATVDGRERTYDVDTTTLTDHRGESVGHAVTLRDVTDRNEYEQRLEVAQRVLRHNLRNDMSVILQSADRIAQMSTNGQAEAAERIIETADDLVDLSEKTHTMVRLGSTGAANGVTIDARARLLAIVEEFRRDHPEATIECDLPASVELRLPDAEFVEIPVRNLVENAIEHNDRDPVVQVRVDSDDEWIRVRIADNGPTIPAMEREVLERGAEDSLQHGSGVGLWLAYWGVRTVGGSLSFDTRSPRGNVVTLEFPQATPSSQTVRS